MADYCLTALGQKLDREIEESARAFAAKIKPLDPKRFEELQRRMAQEDQIKASSAFTRKGL